MDIRTALKQSMQQLRDAGVPSYTLAAELLLLHALGHDRTWIYAHPEEHIDEPVERRLFGMIERRAGGEPTQHITGTQEFWSLEFEVTPEVLIPRPESEHVIEVALDRLALREVRAGRSAKLDGDGVQIADVGTGSGCLAVVLAKELPKAKVYATDISERALVVARRNAERHGIRERIEFVHGSFFEKLPAHFDLIVSNPPYVGRNESATLAREVREHEPEEALYGGEEGYEMYSELISQAAEHLVTGGIAVLELGHRSLPAVQPLFDTAAWCIVGVTNDLAGIPRVIAAERTAIRR
ncbi:MAG: peptide chain release factor N(5)-glutamine methyltransferase [Candidatus Acidiferrum sp.]